VAAPHDAVGGGNHVDRVGTKPADGLDRSSCLHRIGLHDVGVVLARLPHHLAEVVLVIKPGRAGKMLTKGVVREEDLVIAVIGDHVIGPVDHGRLHEGERTLADAERVSGLDTAIAQVAVVGGEALHALRGGAVDLAVRGHLLDGGHVARVVHLHVIGDEDVDPGGIDHARDASEKLVPEGGLGGVDERDLLVDDEVRVVGDAILGGVSVEAAGIPVDSTHPIHVRLELYCGKHVASLRQGARGGSDKH